MNDTTAWSVAALLVGAGVAASGVLMAQFLGGWARARRSRAGQVRRGVRGGDRRAGPGQWLCLDLPRRGLVVVGLSATIAAAQPTASAPELAASQPSAAPAQAAPASAQGQTPAAPSAPAPAEEPAAGAPAPGVTVQLNLDFTNSYFYRGIRQQDKGLIVQPATRITARLGEDSGTSIDAFFGTWNSVGPNAFTRSNDAVRSWYECDLYAGLTLTHGPLSFSTSYTFLTSPSGAFQTVQELGFTAALDDSGWMNELALKPSLTLVVETGANGSDSPDLDNGVYLELGVSPGTSFKIGETTIALSFPASVGFSVSNYYQDAQGRDGAFGFGQLGAKVAIPIGAPGPCGAWTLNAGVAVLFLGDTTRAFNNGGRTELIGTVGLQWNF